MYSRIRLYISYIRPYWKCMQPCITRLLPLLLHSIQHPLSNLLRDHTLYYLLNPGHREYTCPTDWCIRPGPVRGVLQASYGQLRVDRLYIYIYFSFNFQFWIPPLFQAPPPLPPSFVRKSVWRDRCIENRWLYKTTGVFHYFSFMPHIISRNINIVYIWSFWIFLSIVVLI